MTNWRALCRCLVGFLGELLSLVTDIQSHEVALRLHITQHSVKTHPPLAHVAACVGVS